MTRLPLLAICVGGLAPVTAFAWLYPEHRGIALLAIQMLDPAQRTALQQLWSQARGSDQTAACAQMAEPTQGLKPSCLDFAAWPALGGDHSCSAQELLAEVRSAALALKIAAVGAKLKADLAAATRRDQIVNAVRRSDLDLLRADPDMVTRAITNKAHFLLARPDVDMKPEAYASIGLGAIRGIDNIQLVAFVNRTNRWSRSKSKVCHHCVTT